VIGSTATLRRSVRHCDQRDAMVRMACPDRHSQGENGLLSLDAFGRALVPPVQRPPGLAVNGAPYGCGVDVEFGHGGGVDEVRRARARTAGI
jgi:hypothetical protein